MGILAEKMGNKTVKEIFANYRAVTYMHKISDRDFWESIDNGLRSEIITHAEKYLHYDIPCVKATSYMEYFKSGDRKVNEKPYFDRRIALGYLMFAECFENKGRFVDDIIDLLWAICEETTWAISAHAKFSYRHAHIDVMKEKALLPEHDYAVTDIFACETAATLASVVYIMKDVLNDISPMICQRVKYELKWRLIKPYTEANDTWWMDLGRKTHNWSIWSASNALWTVLLTESDEDYAFLAIKKTIDIIDNFVWFLQDDGACDEGPSYFTKSSLTLFNCIERLYVASEGRLDVYDEQKIKDIIAFYAKVRMNEERIFNYSDAECKMEAPMLLYPAAKRIGDRTSMALAASGNMGTSSSQVRGYKLETKDVPQIYAILEYYNEILGCKETMQFQKDVWYPVNEILVSRTDVVLNKGMVLGVKGYHNGVNHNHNDVGSFVLYNDSLPIFIDLGVETYRRQTFSEERYTIWTMRSAYHNLPMIGEIEQKDGMEYRADDVKCDIKDDRTVLSMDIAKAYPVRAEKWVREYDFDKANRMLIITDDFKLDKEEYISFNFMTQAKPEVIDQSIKVCDMAMSFEGIDAEVTIEEIKVDDARLLQSWEAKVYRISIKSVTKITNGKMIFRIVKK